MYVQARFRLHLKSRMPIVPSTTLQTRPDGSFMYTVDGNIVHVHKVEIRGRDLGGHWKLLVVSSRIVQGDH